MTGSGLARRAISSEQERPALAAIWADRPRALHLVLFLAAYVAAAGAAQSLAFIPGIGISIWPASGLFLATLILNRPPTWTWWVLSGLLAEMAANFLWFANPVPVALLIYAGNALEAMAGAVLVRRSSKTPIRLETLREVLALVVLGAGVAPAVSATVGSATLAGFGLQDFATAWPLWWIGDATGVLIVAPLILVLVQRWRDKTQLSTTRIIEACILGLFFLGLVAVSLSGYLPFAYIIMPPLLWAAVRFEFQGAVTALALLALMIVVFAIVGENPFADGPTSEKQTHVMLQLLLAVSAMSALVVAAISHQHQRALRTLQKANIELERRVLERTADLRESEARLRLALIAGGAGTWDYDLETGRGVWSEGHFKMLGYAPEPDGAANLDMWLDSVLPEDRPGVLAAWRQAMRTRDVFVSEHRIRHQASGGIFHLNSTGQVTFDADGKPVRFSGVIFDVTERKRHEKRQQTLIHELNHRVKNTLAIVQSIAMQSLRGKQEGQGVDDFIGRLTALARAHDLLAAERWEGALLQEVVDRAVAVHCGDDSARIAATGPEIWLPPRQALAIAMALHELCTNAVKYGALSNDGGRVGISWCLASDGNRFRLTWEESGGPSVVCTDKRGFGSRLLQRGLKQDLDGEIQIDFRSSGLVCVIEAPVPADQPARILNPRERV